ncbi:hypothetical protein [Polaromonas sp. P5_D5]
MALWQFKVELIPRQWLDAGGDVASLFTEEGCDASIAWLGYSDPKLIEHLGLLLPGSKSWHNECLCWGSDKTEDIQLWREGTAVSSLAVRFDLRAPNDALFVAISQLAQDFELAILVPGIQHVIPCDTESLLAYAKQSEATRFVKDPHAFLSRIEET